MIVLLIIILLFRYLITNKNIEKYDYNQIYEFPDFLTSEECEQLKQIALPKLEKSKVGSQEINTKDRKSSTAFIPYKNYTITNKISQKLKHLLNVDSKKYEDLQVVRYLPNEEYKTHYDNTSNNEKNPRVATFLIYLNDNFEGGETHFPKRNFLVKPKKGKAILFFNVEKDNKTILDKSLHTGLPVKSGIKWVTNVWIRLKDFV